MEGSEKKGSDKPTLVELCKSGNGNFLNADYFKEHDNAKAEINKFTVVKKNEGGKGICQKLEEDLYEELPDCKPSKMAGQTRESDETTEPEVQEDPLLTEGTPAQNVPVKFKNMKMQNPITV